MKTSRRILATVILFSTLFFPMLAMAEEAGTDHTVTVYTVMDNYAVSPDLRTAWGFAAAVVTPNGSTLFDTGPSGEVLLANMKQLGLEPSQFSKVAISHDDDDHTRGLEAFLKLNPNAEVFLAGRAPTGARYAQAAGAKYHNVDAPEEIAIGIRTTGSIDSSREEHALIIDTKEGVVVITGCAHPGIVAILEKVRTLNPGKRLALVMGGFHLFRTMPQTVDKIVEDFRRLKVERVAPSHCSGDYTRKRFKEVYGPNYIEGGAGLVLRFDLPQ